MNHELFTAIKKIAIPLSAQGLMVFAVNMLDTLMIGRLGDTQLSAVALANQVFFIVSLAVPGIADGANVLIAQAWGQKDTARIYQVLAYAYRMALLFILTVMAAAFFFSSQIMCLFTKDQELIEIGGSYLKIVAWSYLFYTLSAVTTGVLRSVRSVQISMVSAFAALMVNGILNRVLIFGGPGFRAMGVEGAACATVAARICEFGIVVFYVYKKEENLQIRVHKLLKLDSHLAKQYFSVSIPVILNELLWAVGESAQTAVLGHMGAEVVAAASICGVVSQLACVWFHGAASAACVVTGNTIGAGKWEALPVLKRHFQRFAVMLGTFACAMVLCIRPFIPIIYQLTGQTARYCSILLFITAFILPFRSVQYTNMMGILRGGGDVRFQMCNDMVFLWGLTVPFGFLAGFWWKLSVPAVYIGLKCDQVIKVFTSEYRLRKGNWVHEEVAE